MIANILYTVIEISASVSAVILVLLLLSKWLNKKFAAKWRYWVWLVLAVRLLVPVNFHVPKPAVKVNVPNRTVATVHAPTAPAASHVSQAAAATAQEQQITQTPKTETQAQPRAVSAGEAAAAVWLLGAALFLTYQFSKYFVFKRNILRWSRPVEDVQPNVTLQLVLQGMNINEKITFRRSKRITSPMMAGFFRPLLLLPETGYESGELEMILRHELIHYKRRDIWYKLLLAVANAVHWFNPIVWLMAREAGKDVEMVCDAEVVKGRDSAYRKQYGETILAAVHKGETCKTAFSTYFYGGAKTMKERLKNILDTGKKHRGIAALCAVVVVAAILGASVACNAVKNENKDGMIDNISLLSADSLCYVREHKCFIEYGSGETVVVPIEASTVDSDTFNEASYISNEVTAVVYGGTYDENTKNNPPIKVLISSDKGETWNSYKVANADESTGENFIGFTTKNDGWLVTAGNTASGYQKDRVFITSDGGKNWTEIGNTTGIYPHVLSGAGFADGKTGFITFRCENDVDPILYRTDDKGKNWTKCSIKFPESLKNSYSYGNIGSPVFNGANGVLPVTLYEKDGDNTAKARYITSDLGKTWTFDETTAPALPTDNGEIIKNDAVGIPDAAFYKAVLQTVKDDGTKVDANGDGKLQASEAQKMPYEVNWDGKGIKSVDGIEKLSVSNIHLNNNKISDITPIVKLSANVKTGDDFPSVELRSNNISDTSLVSFKKSMEKLESGLKIQDLDLSYNNISNASALSGCGVKNLILSHNGIQNADSLLAKNNMFFTLDLSYNKIKSIENCESMIPVINLSNNKIKSVGSFTDSLIESLDLSHNELTDINGIKNITASGGGGPNMLNVSYNKLASLPNIKSWGWTNIEPKIENGSYDFDVRGNYLTENEIITKLPKSFLTMEKKDEDTVYSGKKWLAEQLKTQKK